MLLRMATLIGALMVAGCSVVGIRSGTETPDYTVVERLGEDVEIRRYEPRLAAQVTLPRRDDWDARSKGFRILADYIFGNNKPKEEIAMTAPVEVESGGREIAMTAPVETTRPDADSMRMRFFLPKQVTMETAPAPIDERIELVQIPAETMATLRFTGGRGTEAVTEKQRRLLETLDGTKWAPAGEPVAYFYDPPWTIPFLRRNEVAVPVAEKPEA